MSTNIEFAVEMSGDEMPEKIKSCLGDTAGVDDIRIFPGTSTVVIKSSLPVSILQEKLESTGQRAVIKGYGGTETGSLQAAVAMVGGECGYGLGQVQGVVRFIQANENECIVDGTIDGLSPGLHGLHVHEFGDISDGCNNVGDHFKKTDTPHGAPDNDPNFRHTGDLGNIQVDNDGRAQFRFVDNVLKVWDVVGRTVVVTEDKDDLGKGPNLQSTIDGNSGKRLGCGIIARSAGLFENTKRICACDGVSLWDERNKPLAGPGRRNRL
ncbi:copper chaperone for superoxide dismutase [Planococcus citri]|uniref:copper chaperone for superoxide dismutase n=1 Tax=Planococcus citri TaxID=170843 RepID=UPI0031F9B2F3